MKFKRIEIKSLNEDGTFEGVLSPYGNVDAGGDVVEPGAFTRTLKNQGNTRPLLWNHDDNYPIGQLTLEDKADGLYCKGKLLINDLPKAKEAYALIKNNIVKGLSIGFKTIQGPIEAGIRKLKEVRLYEGSVTPFPLNELAMIRSVKSKKAVNADTDDDGPDDFNEELAEIQTWALRGQMIYALDNALDEVFWSRLSADEMQGLIETVLSQFVEAFTAFVPNYIGAMQERYGGMEAWSRRIVELKAKGKTKTVDGEELTAGDFLIVGDPQDTSTWKLPWKFSTDDKTKSHLRNALARFDQLTGVSDDDKAKAKKRLISLCDKYEIEVSDDFKKSLAGMEHKVGARHSADTKSAIMEACKSIMDGMESCKSGHDSLMALVGDEPAEDNEDEGTSSTKSAKPKSDPGSPHSALLSSIEELEAVLSK